MITSCSDSNKAITEYNNGNYRKAIAYLEKVNIPSESNSEKLFDIRYDSYKNILGEVFGWHGPVRVIHPEHFENGGQFAKYQNYLFGFENIVVETYQKGMLAGIKFRTGEFRKAFGIYEELYKEYQYSFPFEKESLLDDLRASLVGILLGDQFRIEKHKNFYYNSSEYLETINIDSLSLESRAYIDSYLEMEKNISMIGSMIKGEKSLESFSDKYRITQNDFLKIYKEAIQEKDFALAKIVSSKLEKKYQEQLKFEEIWNTYEQGNYSETLSEIESFERFKIDNPEIKNVLRVLSLYSKIKQKKYKDLLKTYSQIEEHELLSGQEYNELESSHFSVNDNDLSIVRRLVASSIRTGEISDYSIGIALKKYPHLSSNLHEMLLQKYLFKSQYGKALQLSEKMKNRLFYGVTISENKLILLNKTLLIIQNAKNKKYLQKEKIKLLEDIANSSMQTLDSYKDVSGLFKNVYYHLTISQVKNTILQLKNRSDKDLSRNIFDLIENNQDLYSDNFGFLTTAIKHSGFNGSIFSGKLIIYSDNSLDFQIPKFFNFNAGYRYSNLHYNLILYNLVLEISSNNYDSDFIFFLISTFFPEVQLDHFFFDQDGLNEATKNLQKRTFNSINQIRVKSDNPIQSQYYQVIKDRIVSLAKNNSLPLLDF